MSAPPRQSMPIAVWLCSNPEHTREFYVEDDGVCPVPGCDHEMIEYGWLGATPKWKVGDDPDNAPEVT